MEQILKNSKRPYLLATPTSLKHFVHSVSYLTAFTSLCRFVASLISVVRSTQLFDSAFFGLLDGAKKFVCSFESSNLTFHHGERVSLG